MGLLLRELGVGPTEEKDRAVRETELVLPKCGIFWDLSVSPQGSCQILQQPQNHYES